MHLLSVGHSSPTLVAYMAMFLLSSYHALGRIARAMSPNYMPWYERYSQRFAQEQAEMAARGFVLDEESLRTHQIVEFHGVSKVDTGRSLTVQYAGAFPSLPPRVFSSRPGDLLVRHHRPGTWEICLFGPGQSRWSADLSGTVAIDEAEEVIRNFRPGAAPVPGDDVPEPTSSYYRYSQGSAIVVPPPISTAIAPGDTVSSGAFRLRFQRTERGPEREVQIRGVILETQFGQGVATKATEPFRHWYPSTQEQTGSLVVLPVPPPFIESAQTFEGWVRRLGQTPREWMAFVFPEQSGTSAERRISWLVAKYSTRKVHLIRAFPIRHEERMARVPGTGGLLQRKVVVVGCGALGSKIAAALAATGVARFGLVDSDIFEPENAVRHEVGVDQNVIGLPKVFGVRDRLISLNPQAFNQVDLLTIHIGGINTGNDERQLFDLLASADLVVECVGVHGVSHFVNDVCYSLGVPSIYASVTNGAWGGEVVRVIPGHTACWLCWFTQYENARPPAASAPEVGIFAPGCDQPTFTGTTYEVGMVADLAAWLAVETLLRENPARRDFGGDYIRWSARDERGVPNMSVEVLTVKRRGHCSWCNPG